MVRREPKRDLRGELASFAQVNERLAPLLAPYIEILQRHYDARLIHYTGELVGEPERAIKGIIETCDKLGFTARVSGAADAVSVKIGTRRVGRGFNKRLQTLFAAATVLTVLWAGGMHAGVDILARPELWYLGLPFAGSLLFILLAHEFGHYLAARRHGVGATLPLLLPVPNPLLGTAGAVIRMRTPVPHRRALFDIGIAGPLAGVVAVVIVTVVGLALSGVMRLDPRAAVPLSWPEFELTYGQPGLIALRFYDEPTALLVNMPPLFKLLQLAVVGPLAADEVLLLHPVAFAGWLGFLVTALNLVPVGQLDGGHIVFAGLRRAYKPLGGLIFVALLFFAFFWPGWLVWVGVLFFVARKRPAPLDDVTPLGRGRTWGAYGAMLLFFLCLTPVPLPGF
ncbi:MAG TPA: site-2 protease family protein [Candidatus Coatesbacteria bacterium]|nr:site-2 protease family protein [Candidatus Coatesbacteria bacterium]